MFIFDLKSLIVYSVVFLLSILLMKRYQIVMNKKDSNLIEDKLKFTDIKYIFIISIIPTLIGGLRYGVGTDYFNYWEMYYWYNNLSILELVVQEDERLFKAIIIISDILFNNPVGMFILSQFITMFFILASIASYKNKLSYSVAIFIFYMAFWSLSLNITRQFIAVAIVLFALKYILKKSFIKYLILIIIASQFHLSALFCIIFYFLSFKRSTYMQYMYYSCIILTPIAIPILLNIINRVGFFQEYIIKYEMLNLLQVDWAYTAKTLFWFLIIVGPIFIFKKAITNQNEKYNILLNILLLELPLVYLGNFNLFANRLALFPQILQIIMIPLTINSIKNTNEKKLVILYYLILFVFIYIQRFVFSNQGDVYPYISIFN